MIPPELIPRLRGLLARGDVFFLRQEERREVVYALPALLDEVERRRDWAQRCKCGHAKDEHQSDGCHVRVKQDDADDALCPCLRFEK